MTAAARGAMLRQFRRGVVCSQQCKTWQQMKKSPRLVLRSPLCSSSEPITVEASSLRYFVSKFNRSLRGSKSKPVPSRKRKKIVTWCSAWKTCVAEHQDRAGSFLLLTDSIEYWCLRGNVWALLLPLGRSSPPGLYDGSHDCS